MPTNTVTGLSVKSLDEPEEKRQPAKSAIDISTVSDYTIGRFSFEKGWSWSESIKPVVKTDSCQNSHVGYCLAGTLEVQLTSGETATIKAGDTFAIPPGHDARVLGDDNFVSIEFLSAATYAKPA
ncbi:cupin domain-containing protein [Sinomonas sp. G460-2]|uniref:cupin domain-containing protein n=1 Tax=Sinomonas sp. G460-2 TaxID=3393464 RepID=UPI0039F10BB5